MRHCLENLKSSFFAETIQNALPCRAWKQVHEGICHHVSSFYLSSQQDCKIYILMYEYYFNGWYSNSFYQELNISIIPAGQSRLYSILKCLVVPFLYLETGGEGELCSYSFDFAYLGTTKVNPLVIKINYVSTKAAQARSTKIAKGVEFWIYTSRFTASSAGGFAIR